MALNSVRTNTGAMVALQSLESTQSQLSTTQKQISTGYRVADSTDDGAAYAVAQTVRSSIGALTSANQQLGLASGLLATTQSALNDISNVMASMRDILTKLGGNDLSGEAASNYQTQYGSMLANLRTFMQDASYHGQNLIGDISGSNGLFTRLSFVRNDTGGTYGITTYSGSAVYGSLSFTSTQLSGATVVALVTAGGTFIRMQSSLGRELNTIGSAVNYVNHQVTYNSDKIDALNSGLGSLVDADLAKESAELTALQIRQQLGTQALSMANQAPSSLMSLFR